jgi:GntR family transcriptional regulator
MARAATAQPKERPKAPKYVEIYNLLRADIISGKYPTGSFLPTEAELMTSFDASRTTIRNAIKMLKSDNFLNVTQGRGTEVLPVQKSAGFSPTLLGRTSVDTSFGDYDPNDIVGQPATIDMIPASHEIATALGIRESENVYRLQREKILDNVSFIYIASYLRCTDFPGLEQYNGKIYFLYKFLEEHYDTKFSATQIQITAASTDFIQSRLLDVAVGSPVLKQVRHTYSGNDIIEYSESYCRSEYMSIMVSTAPEDPSRNPFLTRGF